MNTSDICAVRIAVRERPLRDSYNGASIVNYHSVHENVIVVDGRWQFAFDNIMGPTISQKDVFENLLKPLVHKVMEGFNCTALAYGQTGTGKSYSMGLDCDNYELDNVGVIPRCLKEILSLTNEENSHKKIELQASFIEIYNEKLYDLLSDNITEPIISKGYKFTGGIKKPMLNLQDCFNLLTQGRKNRHVRPTKMNSQSSRSHAIFTIHVRSKDEEKTTSACLNLVDLAGSEGVRRTGHQGLALSEGVHINQGLLSISKVLQAMTLGNKVIPYRDSVLSSVLQDSLNPNSYLTLLACISPHKEDLSETLSTLRFAQNAKHLKHTPHINAVLSEVKKPNSKRPYRSTDIQKKMSSGCELDTIEKKGLQRHNKTFSTPNKIKKNRAKKHNRTINELTPKEKQRMRETIMNGRVLQGPYNRDSTFDPDIENIYSQTSLLSLNISTSTEIDAPSKQHTNYSPVVRKCMALFENVIDNKMSQMMESIKDLANPTAFKTPSIRHTLSMSVVSDSIRSEIRNIVRKELQTNSERPPSTNDSPIFKRPKVLEYTTPVKNNYQENNLTVVDPTKLTHNINELSTTSIQPIGLRRSRRLSSMTANIKDDSIKFAPRRSRRLSVKQVNDERRLSLKLQALQEDDETKENCRVDVVKKTSQKKKRKNEIHINNSVIEAYFTDVANTSDTKKKNTHKKHKNAILQLLNNGSVKDLQFLPQIGLKTAYHIVTQRTINGKFKNMSQVEKLPIWRGTAWERFAKANILI